MKRFILFLLTLPLLQAAYAQTEYTTRDFEILPDAAQNFIRKHFSALTPQQIVIDTKGDINRYEITLHGGIKIEFDHRGKWVKIDCHKTALPDSVKASRIREFIEKNYPGQYICLIEREDQGYRIELLNGTNLAFDSDGSYLRMNS